MVERLEQTLRLCREHAVLGSYDAAQVYMDDMLRSVEKQLASCRRAVSVPMSLQAGPLRQSLAHLDAPHPRAVSLGTHSPRTAGEPTL